MTSSPGRRNQAYPWHWLGALCLFLCVPVYWMFMRSPIPVFRPDPLTAPSGGGDTFLLIHIPPARPGRPSIERRADAWFAALASAGYHVALLSDVHRLLAHGLGLPRKTAVLLFDPGTREVFEGVAPLLAKYKFPAVWVTDPEALQKGDRRYVSRHVWNAMKKSGCWDVGHHDEVFALKIESRDSKTIVIGRRQGAWLHVHWDWTGQKLVERLEAEELLQQKEALAMNPAPAAADGQKFVQALQ
jgi:hypothetical protein